MNASTAFVVRRSDGWSLGRLDDRLPQEVDLDDVLALAGDPARRRDLPEARMAVGAWFEPVTAFVGRPTEQGLEVEGHGGRTVVLDHLDLRLLDQIDETCSVLSVLEAYDGPADRTEVRRRLRHLCDLGRLRVTYEPEPDDEPDEQPEEAPAPPRSLARRTARAAVSRSRFPGRARLRTLYKKVRGLPSAPAPEDLPALADDLEPAAGGLADDAVDDGAGEDPTTTEAVEADEADDEEQAPEVPALPYLDDPSLQPDRDDLVPVYGVFQFETGPPLSLAMVTAAARAHDEGALNEVYDIRRPELPESMLAEVERRGEQPAVLLLSNYIWSVDANLELVAKAKALNPLLLAVHGGPSTPQYEADAEQFFRDNPDTVDVTVRAEGEVTLASVLESLAAGLPTWELDRLAEVEGISYRDPATGEGVRNGDRDRITDLESLPSPYLTGELDHLHPSLWFHAYVIFETNRGCPYGCTFCDWGSSTMSRIRKFSLERVEKEMDWAGERGLPSWVVADANLGIMSRDVDVVTHMASVREQHGAPEILGFNVAKNTTKHLTAIMDRLVAAGIAPHVSLALQTRDDDTLDAVRRQNISTDHYVSMAATFRRHGLPLQADLMLGLPGQTPESLKGDLQFLMSHEIPVRIWITQLLPNSPMNEPAYREEWQVQTDDLGLVVSTASFTLEDREAMMRLRYAHTVFERFGLLRHVMRFVQWEHDVPMTDVMAAATRLSIEDPDRYPLLSWVLRYFDFFPVPPLGWRAFYDEVRRFLGEQFDVPASSGLDAVLALQEHLMPDHGRSMPDEVELQHDYLAYFHDATRSLWETGHASDAPRPLAEYPPATFTVYGDPMDRCGRQMRTTRDPRNEKMTDEFWMSGHLELDSPLVVNYAEIAANGGFLGLLEQVPPGVDMDAPEPVVERRNAIPVQLSSRQGGGEG